MQIGRGHTCSQLSPPCLRSAHFCRPTRYEANGGRGEEGPAALARKRSVRGMVQLAGPFRELPTGRVMSVVAAAGLHGGSFQPLSVSVAMGDRSEALSATRQAWGALLVHLARIGNTPQDFFMTVPRDIMYECTHGVRACDLADHGVETQEAALDGAAAWQGVKKDM